jgi:hypothetical protein
MPAMPASSDGPMSMAVEHGNQARGFVRVELVE